MDPKAGPGASPNPRRGGGSNLTTGIEPRTGTIQSAAGRHGEEEDH